MKVYVDQGANLKKLKILKNKGLLYLVQGHTLEQSFKNVDQVGKAFTIGVSTIGGADMLVGEDLDAVSKLIGKKNDVGHIYSARLNHCDYFITNNPKDFIYNGKREKLEKILNLKIRTSEEFLDRFETV